MPSSRANVILGAMILLATAGDYVTGADTAFTLLYLVPILLGTWRWGLPRGIATSVVCTGMWFTVDATTRAYSLHPLVVAWNIFVELSIFLLVTFLLGTIQSLLDHEHDVSHTDQLTGMPNRRAFYEQASSTLRQARETRQPVTVAFLDLDNFKRVNDRLGHEAGDRLFRDAGRILTTLPTARALTARLGGDEFVVLFSGIGPEEAKTMLGALHRRILRLLQRRRWRVGVSMGGAHFQRAPATVDAVLSLADRLMYQVKRREKNRLIVQEVKG